MKWSVVRTRQRAEPLRTRSHELMEVAIGMMQDVIFWLNKAATYRDPTAHPDADADAPGKDAKYYAQTEYETPLETARKLTNSAICLLRDATFTWDQVSVHEEAAASMEKNAGDLDAWLKKRSWIDWPSSDEAMP